MEVFRNGKSIGIINIPDKLFDTKSGIYLALNVYPQNYVKLNNGSRPFKYNPTTSSLSFKKFDFMPINELVALNL